MAERRYVDFGSNLTGKLYLAKKGSSGSGTEIQATIKSYDVSGGEKAMEQKNYIASNYAIIQKPASFLTLKSTVDSDKSAIDFYEILNGTKTTDSGVDTVTGGGTQSYFRLVYEVETENASTSKTEVRRWTWVNALGSAHGVKFPSEDAIEFDISLICGLTDFTFKQTLDKTLSPLPAIGNYS